MDKQTLSNYGWLVIVTLILAVLLALATPFGTYVGDAVVSVANGFVGASDTAIDEDNIATNEDKWDSKFDYSGLNKDNDDNTNNNPEPAACGIEGHYIGDNRGEHKVEATNCNTHTYTCECDTFIVPAGATYQNKYNKIIGTKYKYTEGEALPCGYKPQAYDILTYGNYSYAYNCYYTYESTITSNSSSQDWYGGWGVRCNANVSNPGEFLHELMGFPVTSISATFYGCTELEVIPQLPDTTINMNQTFYGCTKLTVAPEIPNGVTTLSYTFANCTSLTTAPIIPSGVTTMDNAFSGCTSLKSYIGSTANNGDFSKYTIPNGVTSLSQTFKDCTALKIAPDVSNCISLTNMHSTFYSCSSLTTPPPVIPNGVTDMDYTFYECSSLTIAPTLPDSVTTMSNTFFWCKKMNTYVGAKEGTTLGDFSKYHLPSNLKKMYSTFSRCTLLTTPPVIPEGVTDMGRTFTSTSITVLPNIPNGVTNMSHTFHECEELTSVDGLIIPSGVTDISYVLSVYSAVPGISGTITINATPTSYNNAFYWRDMTNINITGSASKDILNLIGSTGDNWTPIS